MLDHLKRMAIFAQTVEHGSFSGAAKALKLSPSVVSHHISALEETLNSPLLYRSTRRLSLTEHGHELYAASRKMLDAADEGLLSITEAVQEPAGTLRVTAPSVLSRSFLVERFTVFASEHPKVTLNLDFTDQRRDVVADGIDVAIRMGWLKDSALKARKLRDVRRVLVVSRGYVGSRPHPRKPEDLQDWNWINLSPVEGRQRLFHKQGKQMRLRTESRIFVNDANALSGLVRGGGGLAVLPHFLVEDDIASGQLIHMFPDWEPEPIAIHAVWQPNAPRTGLVGRLIDAVAATAD